MDATGRVARFLTWEWVNQRIPLLFVFRIVFCVWIIVWSALWLLFGFDSTFEGVLTNDPNMLGTGTHFSTLLFLSIITYVSLLNLQNGGLMSIRQIPREFWVDLRIVFGRVKGKEVESSRSQLYPGVQGVFFSLFLAFSSLFIFEVGYVWIQDYLNFGGDMWWPIYHYIDPQKTTASWRNFAFAAIIFILPVMVYQTKTFIDGKAHRWQYRLDKKWGGLVLACLAVWALWIWYPFPHPEVSYMVNGESVSVWIDGEHYETSFFDKPIVALTVPENRLFPQTAFAYYTVPQGAPYFREDMGGVWAADDGIHALNVAAKGLVFAVLAYPLMVRVEKV